MIQAVRRSLLPLVSFVTTAPETTFDANGEALVSVAGDEDVAAIYLTVGDGSEPADPTAGANDGFVLARQGTIATGVKITTGNDAYVKVRGADAAGNLGPVVTSQQGRRVGPFHKDTTDRSHTGDTAETTLETITIPANMLGSNGGFRLELRVDAQGAPAGSRTLRVRYNSTQVFALNFSIANIAYITLLAFNDGATNDQHMSGFILLTNASGNQVLLITSDTAEDTTADMDVDVTVQFSDSSDDLTLEMTHLTLIGTN
jgi:hypothetical protein